MLRKTGDVTRDSLVSPVSLRDTGFTPFGETRVRVEAPGVLLRNTGDVARDKAESKLSLSTRLVPCSSVVERLAVNEDVAGSSPAGGAKKKRRAAALLFFFVYARLSSKPLVRSAQYKLSAPQCEVVLLLKTLP